MLQRPQDTLKNNWRKPWLCGFWKRTYFCCSKIVLLPSLLHEKIDLVNRPFTATARTGEPGRNERWWRQRWRHHNSWQKKGPPSDVSTCDGGDWCDLSQWGTPKAQIPHAPVAMEEAISPGHHLFISCFLPHSFFDNSHHRHHLK